MHRHTDAHHSTLRHSSSPFQSIQDEPMDEHAPHAQHRREADLAGDCEPDHRLCSKGPHRRGLSRVPRKTQAPHLPMARHTASLASHCRYAPGPRKHAHYARGWTLHCALVKGRSQRRFQSDRYRKGPPRKLTVEVQRKSRPSTAAHNPTQKNIPGHNAAHPAADFDESGRVSVLLPKHSRWCDCHHRNRCMGYGTAQRGLFLRQETRQGHSHAQAHSHRRMPGAYQHDNQAHGDVDADRRKGDLLRTHWQYIPAHRSRTHGLAAVARWKRKSQGGHACSFRTGGL